MKALMSLSDPPRLFPRAFVGGVASSTDNCLGQMLLSRVLRF